MSQSYRCSDIDKQIPELMGVSKAVLENVVSYSSLTLHRVLSSLDLLPSRGFQLAARRACLTQEEVRRHLCFDALHDGFGGHQEAAEAEQPDDQGVATQVADCASPVGPRAQGLYAVVFHLSHYLQLQKQLQDAKATISRGNEKMAQYDQAISALDAEISARKAKLDECHRLVRSLTKRRSA